MDCTQAPSEQHTAGQRSSTVLTMLCACTHARLVPNTCHTSVTFSNRQQASQKFFFGHSPGPRHPGAHLNDTCVIFRMGLSLDLTPSRKPNRVPYSQP